jgi:hypothetical protein
MDLAPRFSGIAFRRRMVFTNPRDLEISPQRLVRRLGDFLFLIAAKVPGVKMIAKPMIPGGNYSRMIPTL